MANQKLNEVTTVPTASINNVKTFLAVMNDGSIQQMSKADMASVLGGLIGIATTSRDGLQSKNYVPIYLGTNNDYKYIRLHKTRPIEWVSFGFKFYLMAGGVNEFYCLICGNTNNGNDGTLKFVMLGNTKDISGWFKILWKQNSDKSIEIYLAAIKNMGMRSAIKENLNGVNDAMVLVKELNENEYNVVSIA